MNGVAGGEGATLPLHTQAATSHPHDPSKPNLVFLNGPLAAGSIFIAQVCQLEQSLIRKQTTYRRVRQATRG